MDMIDYRVYLVTDEPSRYRGDWIENIVAAVDGGVTCVQYRDTESDPATQLARARRLQAALRARGVPLIINNDAELAATIGAEGLHVGQNDLPVAAAREIVGESCEIGLSITEIAQLGKWSARPDCLGIGPVYDARKTKANAADAMGADGLRAIVAATPEFANCAIGGITLSTAPAVLAAGAKGLAIVSAFSMAEDPTAVARQFRSLFK